MTDCPVHGSCRFDCALEQCKYNPVIKEEWLKPGVQFEIAGLTPWCGSIFEVVGYYELSSAAPPHRVWWSKPMRSNGDQKIHKFQLHETHMIERFANGQYKPVLSTLFEVKCECGAEKVNTTHSGWCPKYV